MEARIGTVIGMTYPKAATELVKYNPSCVPVRYGPDQEELFLTAVHEPERIRVLVDKNNFVTRTMLG